ncbi:uncharacterized protein LOC143213488 [Lasioglossum baleicum]|uniref:uncharacterized protein LOC143213488 n=1 Tax=Lasioglossum baleicum TaxID=434251 RepID=UPI003FCCC2A0
MAGTFTVYKRKLRLLQGDPWHEWKLIKQRPAVNPFPGLDLTDKIPLPIECIAHIVQYLPFPDRARLEQVSRRWRTETLASFHPIRHLGLTDWRWPQGWSGRKVTTEAFYWLVRRAQNIQKITIAEETLTPPLRPQVIAIALKEAPELTTIDFTAAPIRPSAMRNLAEAANRLEQLSIGECCGNVEMDLQRVLEGAAQLTSFRATRTVLKGRPLLCLRVDLKQLTLDRCKGLRAEFLQGAMAKLQKLEYLELNLCDPLPNYGALNALRENIAIRQTRIQH